MNIKLQYLLLYLVLGGFAIALFLADSAWQARALVLRDSVILAWVASIANILFGNSLGRLLGIRPRQLLGLLGVVFSPLLHRDIGHLLANTLPFLALGWLILLQGKLQGDGDFYTVTVTILLIGGLGTWLFGREAIHLGASGLIFGYIGFLLVEGYLGPTLLTVGFAALVFLLYGSQLWSLFPSSNEKMISWEGHLFGFIGGIVAGTQPDFLSTVGTALQSLTQ
ncbi:MAG: rhomboid family intramembrane serine protease [Phormidesmis sp.]